MKNKAMLEFILLIVTMFTNAKVKRTLSFTIIKKI